MRNKLLLFLLILVMPNLVFSKTKGYKIQLDIKGLENKKIQLAHYYGRPLTVYRVDSLELDSKGKGILQVDTTILGGLYMIINKENNDFAEFILNNGDELKLKTNATNLRKDAVVTGSQDNVFFYDYQNMLTSFEKDFNKYKTDLATAKSTVDSTTIKNKIDGKMQDLNTYRTNIAKNNPNAFLSHIFNAMMEPEVPKGVHYNANGTVDSLYSYYYIKNHYWDNFPFNDERIAFTPIYHDKLENYFNKLVFRVPDSVSKESLLLLEKSKNSKELFKYTLWYTYRYIFTSKIMGMDAAILPIADKYFHNRSNLFWIDDKTYDKVMEKVMLLGPSSIGNIGNNLPLSDSTGKTVMLHSIPADYLVMVFWAPDCGHCRTELPKIDSFYRAELHGKYKDIQLIAIKTEGDSNLYRKFIKDNNLTNGWMHLNDDKRKSNYRYYYDVETTPMIYILNKDRKIIGKRLNFTDIGLVIDFDKNKK